MSESEDKRTGNALPPEGEKAAQGEGPSRLVEKTVSAPGGQSQAAPAEGGAAAPAEASTDAPGDAPAAPKKSDLPTRLLTAAVAIPLILAFLYAGGIWWMLLVCVVMGLGTTEFYMFMEAKGMKPHRLVGISATIGLVVIAQGSNAYYVTHLLMLAILGVLMWQLMIRRETADAISAMSVTVFGVIYVGWLGSHFVLLRNVGVEVEHQYLAGAVGGGVSNFLSGIGLSGGKDVVHGGVANVGMLFMLLAIGGTFLADTGGYFVGRKFGKTKLAPSISPKKSWEGLGGSLLGATLGCVLLKLAYTLLLPEEKFAAEFEYYHCAILGALITFFGLAGDLVESMLKRDARVKDASGLLPGHGGFLDRLDSLNFTVPLTYYYAKVYYFMNFTPDVGEKLSEFLQRYGF